MRAQTELQETLTRLQTRIAQLDTEYREARTESRRRIVERRLEQYEAQERMLLWTLGESSEWR